MRFLRDAGRSLTAGGAVAGLPPGALALVLARMPPAARWVWVPDEDAAERLIRDIRFHCPTLSVDHYPADDLLPYDGISPHPSRPGRRIALLEALAEGEPKTVVASVEALMTRVPAKEVLAGERVEVRAGQDLPLEWVVERLVLWGYISVPSVEEPATFSRRGGVLDIWPADASHPFRIDLWDEEVESVRIFDEKEQRSTGEVSELLIRPAREWLADAASLDRVSEQTRSRSARSSASVSLRRRVLDTLENKLSFSGVEDWLPALHPVVSVFDRTPNVPVIAVEPDRIREAFSKRMSLAVRRFESLTPEEQPLVNPDERYDGPEAYDAPLTRAATVLVLPIDDTEDVGARDNEGLRVGKGDLGPVVAKLKHFIESGWRTVLVTSGHAEAEQLSALLQPHDLKLAPHQAPVEEAEPGALSLVIGELSCGFQAPADQLAVIAGHEIFVERKRGGRLRAHRAFQRAATVAFGSLKDGDLVVHAHHGIGRYDGMDRIDVGSGDTDLLRLEYRGGDRLYLPVHKLDLLSRYRSASEAREPRLDKLGGDSWGKRRAKVRDAMVKTAADLLKLYAEREVVEIGALPAGGDRSQKLALSFPYELTPDQQTAVDDVMEDLDSAQPMDRLVVGDVGFGKTEVAMRAAMRVVENGQQVALLCPTTVLAYQHHDTWRKRFEGLGVRVAMLSRLTSAKEGRQIAAELATGSLDIVIGTTRLLGRSIGFENLGMVVLDEEHRFGVRQKERLKQLRTEVHVLSLSATPIPRSLHLSLAGVRALSVIATPPVDRRAIRTRLARFDEQTIRSEILREMQRGGQVFFVHNRVQSLSTMAQRLAELVPEARFEMTHGQMAPKELEERLLRFVRKQADVLVTTSIIESGVDLPNVNCILIDRADHFGLAQLYQMRGRVGRSHRRARCVLLVPSDGELLGDGRRRLRVLLDHQELGAGFAVASADLEQRGAGSILGAKQHGHIDAVGFETYLSLFEEALAIARGELSRDHIDPEITVRAPAYIPEDYLPDMEDRLREYQMLSRSDTPSEVRAAVDRLEDRLGPAPKPLVNLSWMLQLRLRCRALAISHIHWLQVRVLLDRVEGSPLTDAFIDARAAEMPARLRRLPDGKVEVRFTEEEAEFPFRFLHWVLRLFETQVLPEA